jgi:membrane-associated phospholipid phosphatase
VPIWLAAFIAFFAPFVFFVLFQIRRRSLFDLATTTLGLLRSLITAAVFQVRIHFPPLHHYFYSDIFVPQVWIKWLIGGLRPHFLAVCQPNVPISGTQSGGGFAAIMYDRSVCTGDKDTIDDSLESFPSGHSTAGFAGLMYLALYFNAQLKVISAHNSAYWTMVLFFTPILGATLIAGALTIDEFHNWYDVLAGAIIGTATALVAFRQTFASIWDFRFNHILLPRTSSWFLRSPVANFGPQFFTYQWQNSGAVALDAYRPFTREGGWGTMSEEHVGAPFDALVDNAATGGARGNPNGNLDPLSRAEAGRRTRM